MSSLRSWLRGSSSTATTSVAAPNDTNGQKTASQANLAVEQEAADIEDAMSAAGLIMNDDIEGAEARLRLKKDSSIFHLLVLGVATFMKSILGFEKEIMAEASERLSDCETKAWAGMKKAQKDAEKAAGGGYWYGRSAAASDATADKMFPPGSEFALVHAEAQLMNAVVAVMHESLTEGIKGFYKLRKAFISLNAIMESEVKALKQVQGAQEPAQSANLERKQSRLSDDLMPGSFDETEFADFENIEKGTDSDIEFVDASTGLSGVQTPGSAERSSKPASGGSSGPDTLAAEKLLAELSLTSGPLDGRDLTAEASRSASRPGTPSRPAAQTGTPQSGLQELLQTVSVLEKASSGKDASLFTTTRDIFIHSGANMCFGALLLVISMVPPAFSRLLQIVGFKGDRNRGVQMLWQSTKFPNVNGAVASLVLLAYYNGLLGFSDILPSERDIEELTNPEADGGEIVGYPKERCTVLLADMRTRYPDSRLWLLEEARVLANTRKLEEAIETLLNITDSNMRQITALTMFELSFNAIFAMDWSLARKSFLRCIELNEWSHALCFYMVGCAALEQYRDAYHEAARLTVAGGSDSPDLQQAQAAASKHKKEVEEYFRKVPGAAGKRRFLTRQMPVEAFVCRKLQKWEDRAAALGVDLVDAVGPSPAMEITYIWNGSKRMPDHILNKARTLLLWERCTAAPDAVAKIREELDEVAIHAVVDASFLRCLDRLDDARLVLDPILKLDRSVVKGPTKDDYVLAAAHYEIAAENWVEASLPHHWPAGASDEEVATYRRKKVDGCLEYLEKVAKWEGFVLDARFGMRVQTGLDSARWLKEKKGWA